MKEYIIIENEGEIEIKGWYNNKEFVPNEKVVEVPETFEELKKLCRAIGCVVHPHDIVLYGCLIGSEMIFCEDGAIFINTEECFAERVSVERMWQIIKNLIGEE